MLVRLGSPPNLSLWSAAVHCCSRLHPPSAVSPFHSPPLSCAAVVEVPERPTSVCVVLPFEHGFTAGACAGGSKPAAISCPVAGAAGVGAAHVRRPIETVSEPIACTIGEEAGLAGRSELLKQELLLPAYLRSHSLCSNYRLSHCRSPAPAVVK
jgi:hypothetical protein